MNYVMFYKWNIMVNKAKLFYSLHIWVAVTVIVIAIWEYLLRRREKKPENTYK